MDRKHCQCLWRVTVSVFSSLLSPSCPAQIWSDPTNEMTLLTVLTRLLFQWYARVFLKTPISRSSGFLSNGINLHYKIGSKFLCETFSVQITLNKCDGTSPKLFYSNMRLQSLISISDGPDRQSCLSSYQFSVFAIILYKMDSFKFITKENILWYFSCFWMFIFYH